MRSFPFTTLKNRKVKRVPQQMMVNLLNILLAMRGIKAGDNHFSFFSFHSFSAPTLFR